MLSCLLSLSLLFRILEFFSISSYRISEQTRSIFYFDYQYPLLYEHRVVFVHFLSPPPPRLSFPRKLASMVLTRVKYLKKLTFFEVYLFISLVFLYFRSFFQQIWIPIRISLFFLALLRVRRTLSIASICVSCFCKYLFFAFFLPLFSLPPPTFHLIVFLFLSWQFSNFFNLRSFVSPFSSYSAFFVMFSLDFDIISCTSVLVISSLPFFIFLVLSFFIYAYSGLLVFDNFEFPVFCLLRLRVSESLEI